MRGFRSNRIASYLSYKTLLSIKEVKLTEMVKNVTNFQFGNK